MTVFGTSRIKSLFVAAALIAVLVVSAATTFAAGRGGGNVLPATAQPHGYSLQQAAAATAYFNATPTTRDPNDIPRNFPFQILYLLGNEDPAARTFTVKPGTEFYVPIVFSDNSAPVLEPFPYDVNNARDVSDYYFNRARLGAEYIEVVVDGSVTRLSPQYAVGALPATSPLRTGGTLYTGVGVFLTPMSPGTHTVTIRFRLTGASLQPYGGVWEFSATYTVIVEPHGNTKP